MTTGLRRLVREHPWDIGLSLAAVLVMLPTCWYRYGLDQSLYHYVGTGWLRGMLPYRDSFDIKPPAIYALYALANLCFGQGQHAIRIAEIGCVLALGFITAAAVTPQKTDDPGKSPEGGSSDGLAGMSALLLGAWYVTLFGFWDTGQVELWEAACIVVSFALVSERPPGSAKRLLGAGGFAGAAVLFKITAAIPALGLAAFCLVRCQVDSESRGAKSALRAFSTFALGFAAPVAATALYFAAHGAFSALREWFLYVPYYAREPLDPSWVASVGPEMLLARCGFWFGVFGVLCLVGLSEARRSQVSLTVHPAVWATLLLAAGALSIAVQRRYFSYHPVVLGPLLVLAAAPGVRAFVQHRRAVTAGAALLLALGSFLSAPVWTGEGGAGGSYRDYVLHAWWPEVTGKLTAPAFAAVFVGPFGYSYAEQEAVAALVTREKPRPQDRLHVRGYGTTIYVLSGLYSPSRFLMEGPVRDSYLASYEPEWAREHARILLEEHRPRFFVTNVGSSDDIELIENAGYGKVGSRGRYLLLELGLGSVPLSGERLAALVTGHSFQGTALGGFDLRATFDAGGRLDSEVQAESHGGAWRILENRVCVKWNEDTPEKCAVVYDRGTHYVVFDETSQELADLRPSEAPE